MKFIILLILINILFAVQASELDYDKAFEEQSNLETLQKAENCIVKGKDSVNRLIYVGESIFAAEEGEIDFMGAGTNLIEIAKNIFQMLDDCQTLFCFGPTFERCENKHGSCEKTGLIVYPKCKQGFTNWACCVCANECPEGFRDDGLYCAKPKAYGRGAGYVLWQQKQCESQNPQGCEKNGLMWYPKCKPGFHNVGCCICSPDCPSGWDDIGVSCKKPESYGRGVGYPVTIGEQCIEEYDKQQQGQNKLQSSQQVSCKQIKLKINQLNKIVEDKFYKAQQDPNVYQPGLPDYLKQLAQQVDRYAQSCAKLQVPQ